MTNKDELDFKNPIGRNERLASAIKKRTGVWQYPFQKVKKTEKDGWHIDWFDYQGGMPDIEKVSIGDKIADDKLNMTAYWQINFVDTKSGKIFLTPIEPNPFLTGVGAGGAKIDDSDMRVFSGEHEKEDRPNPQRYKRKKLYKTIGYRLYFKGHRPFACWTQRLAGCWCY